MIPKKDKSPTAPVTTVAEKATDRRSMLLEADLAEPIKEGLFRWIIGVAALGIFGALLIAGLTPVHMSVTADGRLLPAEGTRPLQSEYGGRVVELNAANGDFVTAGQQIMRFDRSLENAQAAQLQARRGALLLEREMHLAVLEGQEFTPDQSLSRSLAQGQLDRFSIEAEAAAARLLGLDQDIALAQASVAAADAQLGHYEQREKLLADRVTRLNQLLERSSAVSLVDRDLAELSLIEARTDISAARNARDVGLVSLERAMIARTEFLLARRQDASRRITEIDADLAELEEELRRAETFAAQDRLVAPVDGIVQNLSINSHGQVVPRELTVLELVPRDEELIVEVQVPASRIGDVSAGMRAQVKIATFDFTRYGSIEAEVFSVSPSSDLNAQGVPHYIVRLRLDTMTNPATQQMLLRSGLAVSADLKVGEQTLLAYFLKPIRTLKDQAMREA